MIRLVENFDNLSHRLSAGVQLQTALRTLEVAARNANFRPFTSKEAESEFWLSTDTTEYFSDDAEEFHPPNKIPASLKIATRLMIFIKRVAKDKGISHDKLSMSSPRISILLQSISPSPRSAATRKVGILIGSKPTI